jgi:NAD-dependent aldehyde dehydrogenases
VGNGEQGLQRVTSKISNPFSQAQIFELQAASSVDVDSAYSAAEAAFKSEMTKPIEIRQQVIN